MLEAKELVALVEAARDEDRAAFGRLFEEFAPVLHGILLSRLSPSDADDLVQEVFVSALGRLGQLRDPERFPGWLISIARNRANDFLRVTKRWVNLPNEMPAAENVSVQIRVGRVMQIIRSMPEAYRETLTLRLVEGMTGPEIAARTGLSPDSVRVNLHRGLKTLRERIEQNKGRS
jgi:RNA polymerase sigma-70 factor, ECF subfamily